MSTKPGITARPPTSYARVGGGRLGGRADPGDALALDDDRRVAEQAERARRGAGSLVTSSPMPVTHGAAHRQILPITSARSRPSPARSPSPNTTRPSATTWVTSAADAANTAVRSSAPVPAVRTRSVAIVTRSARCPTAIRPASPSPGAGGRSWRRREQLGGGPVAALLGRQALVELHRPHLLEQVDHGVAVAAEGERAPASCRATARADAVAEVALGGRAEAGVRRRRRRAARRRRR